MDENCSDEDFSQPPARKSIRRKLKPWHLNDFVIYSAISGPAEAQSYSQVMKGPEAAQRIIAMQQEYTSIIKNEVMGVVQSALTTSNEQ